MQARIYRIVVVAVALLLALAILPAPRTAAAELKIGAILPISGYLAAVGQGQKVAMDMAVEEINAAGGVNGKKIQVMVVDDSGKIEESITAAKRVIDRDKVLMIWGPFTSGQSESTFPVANRAGVPIVSSSSAKPGVAAANRPWAFRNSVTTDKRYRDIVQLWVKRFNIKRVVILFDSQEPVMKATAEQDFPMLVKNAGAQVVDSITHGTKDVDHSAQITRLKSVKPDGVMVSAVHGGAALIAKEMVKQGLGKLPVMGGIAHDSRWVELAGSAAEGAWTTNGFWTDSPDANMQKFLKAFKERSKGGFAPNAEIAALYDTVHISAKIMKEQAITGEPAKLQEEREKIRRGWEAVKEYPGVTGLTTMTPSGDTFKTTEMLVVREGRFQRIPQ
ncbi:MAG: ABC transporter substrate-binding protein [Candidatus Tectomicrobia bacterium]|nr:ABC transporter substrate-binding protein [Candidatus Tectomicrobia bacterium]